MYVYMCIYIYIYIHVFRINFRVDMSFVQKYDRSPISRLLSGGGAEPRLASQSPRSEFHNFKTISKHMDLDV